MTETNVLYWSRTTFAQRAIVEAITALPAVNLKRCDDLPDVLAAIDHAEVLVLSDCPTAEARPILERINKPGARLQAVHFITAGREGFSAAGTFRADVSVSGPEGAIAPTVAEHAIALALALNRQLLPAYEAQKQAHWDRSFAPQAVSLEGETALIVGAGPIGREIARRARAFGMRCVAVTRTQRHDDSFDAVHGLAKLDTLLPTASLIALCIALSSETHHLMSWPQFAICRPTATLVNVGRGGLIDTGALEDALRRSRIAGAGIDVTEPEPLPPGHSLWSAPNLLITGHYSGGGSRLAYDRIAAGAVRAIIDR